MKKATFLWLIGLLAIGLSGRSAAQEQLIRYPALDPVLDKLLLAKAPADECFNGVGQPITYPDAQGNCATGVPKVNESYVWGMAKAGPDIWFGTAANVLCGVLFGYLEVAEPVVGSDYVCERSVPANGSMPARSDSRVPSIYRYNLVTRQLTQIAGPKNGGVAGLVSGWTDDATALLRRTSGFRSAGSLGEVAIMAGPGRSLPSESNPNGVSSINVFAFNSATGALIGFGSWTDFSNIRKWFAYDGVLYTGVGLKTGGGKVLRWNGPEDPLGYTEVGVTGSEIAELVVHEGRLFGASWPLHGENIEVPAGLYMSPPLPSGGLTASTVWEMVWRATDYEPDPVTATTYGTGALASFDGYLYWGTMHVPGRGAIAHEDVYGEPATEEEGSQTFLNTLRAISIFRGRNFGLLTPPELEVVYGESELMAWDDTAKQWVSTPTGMGPPLWGDSGFGNPFNNYTWTMEVYGGALYIGTMDWSYLAFGSSVSGTPSEFLDQLPFSFGADILRIESSARPGVFESVDGAGNDVNYGIRTIVADDAAMFFGSANPMNLMTDLTDNKPEGGWELIRARTQHSLALAPASDLENVGTRHQVRATLTPPKAGVSVSFSVTGANSAAGTVLTDSSGIARWSYVGTVGGTDQIRAVADVVGYGWSEDQVTATAQVFWLGSWATIEGNAKINGRPVTFDGYIGDAGGKAVGSLTVNYTRGKRCVLRPDAGARFTVVGNTATLTGWTSDDLGTGGCTDSANVKVILIGRSGTSRGSIVLDIGADGLAANTGELGPTPLALTGGKVVVVVR